VTANASPVPRRSTQGVPDRELPLLSGTIGLLPLPCLLLAQDGTAIKANERWAFLSGVPEGDSLGDGWLQAVAALDRIALRAIIRDAAVKGIEGSADIWLATPGAEQWSRWSWGPVPPGQLLVTVVSLAVRPPLRTHHLPRRARGW
jgi:PAS domain-containing protein